VILSIPTASKGQSKKYDLKSGIITFVETTTKSGIRETRKVVVYFDDFGTKERRDIYQGDRITETALCNGRTLYTIVHAAKSAFHRGASSNGTEVRFEVENPGQATAAIVRNLPNITLAGKTCEAFERVSSSEKTVYAGWGHICLLTEVQAPGMRRESKAVSIEENVVIPAEKFEVPRGYTIR
jgi:hypothetical protein